MRCKPEPHEPTSIWGEDGLEVGPHICLVVRQKPHAQTSGDRFDIHPDAEPAGFAAHDNAFVGAGDGDNDA